MDLPVTTFLFTPLLLQKNTFSKIALSNVWLLTRSNCLILGLAWVEPSYAHYSRDEFPRIGTYACG
jgi:hypothetical protein